MYFKVKGGKENSHNDLIEYIPPRRIRIEHIDDSYTLHNHASIKIRLLLFLRARNHKMLFYFYGVKLRLFSRKCSEEKKD